MSADVLPSTGEALTEFPAKMSKSLNNYVKVFVREALLVNQLDAESRGNYHPKLFGKFFNSWLTI